MNWWFITELLGRSAVLLVSGDLLRRLAKNRTAAFRHRLLVWVFSLLLLLPALFLAIPEIPISIAKPNHEAKAIVTVVELSSTVIKYADHKTVNWVLWIWLSGVVAACFPLLAGSIWVRRLAKHATYFSKVGEVEVLVSKRLRVPVAFGLLRPCIMLPAEAQTWSSERCAAVIAHERAHIARHDLHVQMATQFIAALWWFQPLAWMLRGKLRMESEFACDEAAIQGGLRPSDYASELVAVARHANYAGVPWTAIGMVHSSDLENRIRAILNPSTPSHKPPRIILLGFILGSAAVAASSLTINSDAPAFNRTGVFIMKRTLFSALLTSAGLSAATIGGVIHDVSNTPVADAKVTLLNPDTSYKTEVRTDASGAFQFSGSGAGQYILRIEKPGFTSIMREFDVDGDAKQEREFTLTPAGEKPVEEAAANNAAANGETPKIVRIGGAVAQNNLITKVTPVYPTAAKADRVQGTVEIRATISKDGVPVTLSVASSPSDDLSQSALEAVRQWRYTPTLLNGSPVMVATIIVVNYTLAP